MSPQTSAPCLFAFALLAGFAGGCSSSSPRVSFALKESTIARVTAADSPIAPETANAEVATAHESTGGPARGVDELLGSCVPDGKKRCLLTPADAAEVCRSMTPTAALHAFAGNKKLRVAYLTRDMEAWSTGHARQTKSRARFDEEVMVLASRSSKSSVVVQGGTVTYEVLRWDGSCASLMGDELTFRRAPRPVRPIRVERLYLPAQDKLLGDARIHAAADREGAACSADDKTVACDVARRAFGDVVVARAGKLGL